MGNLLTKLNKITVLDFETEGLNLSRSRPWQVAWVVGNTRGAIYAKHDYMIDIPDINVSPQAAAVTGFDREKYDRLKRPAAEVLGKLWADISGDVSVVGQHIIGFDMFMIGVLQRLAGAKIDYSFFPRIVDTKALSKAINLDLPLDAVSGLISWQMKVLNCPKKAGKNSQLALLKKFAIPFDEKKLHDALYDVEMTTQVFLKLGALIKC